MTYGHIQYHFLKILSRFICLFPYSLVCRIGRLLGLLGYFIAAKQRKRGISQIKQALNLSEQEARRTIRTLFGNLGQTIFEVMYTPALTPEKIRKYVSIEGLDHLRNALNLGHGVVLLTAHMGNWEWMGGILAHTGLPVTTIAKPQPNLNYTLLLDEYREMMGLEVFNRGSSELIGAARALKSGKALGFLADEDGGEHGVFVDFFHKKAATPIGPATFAKRFGSVVIPVFIVHRPNGGHRIIVEPPLPYEKNEDAEQEIYQNTLTMTRCLENIIRSYPTEWLWFRKRWNTKYHGE